jgi:hypothetical protein
VAYGYHGAAPTPAYAYPDDYTVIWYDATATGPDEEGAVGKGLVRFVDGGKRYPAGVLPTGNVAFFDPAGTVTQLTSLPAASNLSAPSWPGSPAASRSG